MGADIIKGGVGALNYCYEKEVSGIIACYDIGGGAGRLWWREVISGR